jgi:hypothetical protein
VETKIVYKQVVNENDGNNNNDNGHFEIENKKVMMILE